MTDLAFATISDLATAFRERRLSPVELLDDVLHRAEDVQTRLNPFAHLDPEGAMRDARAAEDRQMRGAMLSPLDGIPTSIKDLIAQAGLPQRFGSRASATDAVTEDAPSVARLRAAGAVLLGKSTTSEFGCKAVGDSPLTGITRNPWDVAKTPGGSSGGAAAMVAAGLVPYALGTDGGGSVRIPASLCGLFGIKAQFARVPVFPTSATPTLGHVGPLARSVEDAATVLTTIAGFDRRDPFSVAGDTPDFEAASRTTRPLRIAYSPTLGFAEPDPEITAITRRAADGISSLGHTVEEVGHVMDDPADLWSTEAYTGVAVRLQHAVETSPDLLDSAVLAVLQKAIGANVDAYFGTVFARYALRERMRVFYDRYDLLISPTLPCAAFPVGEDVPPQLAHRSIVDWVFYTYPFNLTGQPAASLPIGFTDAGLPVGLQVAGPSHDEATILALCRAWQDAFPEASTRRPPP